MLLLFINSLFVINVCLFIGVFLYTLIGYHILSTKFINFRIIIIKNDTSTNIIDDKYLLNEILNMVSFLIIFRPQYF